ncbi:MAG TPA: hypothetical protein VGS58_12595, partial [Candidatus Sulfopaludibacter sp.]|nr:hypothetical protein [Candidatus Sulfopaludibacter sp.]
GGIQLLSAKAGMHPVIAKLLVETALFFANFAIQRLFIFNPVEERAAPVIRRREVIALVVLILAAVAAIELYGFATSHLFAQDIWFPLGMRRFHRYAGLFLEAGLPLLVMFPWLFSGAVAFLALAGTALAAPMGLLSAACVLWSAWTLGSRIIRGAAAAPATLLGIAVYVFLMGGVARLPVNYPVVWACVLAIPIVLEPRRAWHGVRALAARIAGTELRAPTERAALALLVFVMGMHWLVVLKPEAGADSLAMHLAIPANIAVHHRMTYEPTLFLWSVMPMGADWAFSIAYLFGGELASRLLNFAMLLLLLAMLYQAVRRWVSRPLAFLLLALFAATPVIQYVTGALYVENFLAAMLFGAAKALWQFAEGGDRRLLHLAAVLCGTALATKVGAFAFLLLLLPFAIQAARRHRLRLGAGAVAVVLLLAVGLPSYLVAWRKTGNPVFPFYNQRIPSPVLDRSVVIVSPFHQPLNWKTPYNLTFRTSDFYEGQNGSFGFHYLLLAPLALACLLIDRKRPLAIAATAGFGAIVIVLATEPNVRYVYAALPFLFVPFSATLAWVQSNQRALFRALIACLLACLVLNIYFLPASNWYHKEFYSQEVFMPHGRDRLIRGDLPLRDVVRHFAREHPGRAVLFTSDNDLADVSATAYENNWHQVGTFNRLQAAASRPDMLKLLREWNVEYLIGNAPQPDAPVSPPALQDLLDHCALPEYENHWFFLAKVDPTCTDRTMPLLQPAVYDDFDMAVLFRGDWRRTQHFAEPIRGTLTYADAPGAEASVTFEGRGLTYIFSKQPDRGMAEILIDGAVRATVDLYSPQIEWQRAYRVCCLAYGRHMATIRVLGQSRAGAAGRIVDVDGVAVE